MFKLLRICGSVLVGSLLATAPLWSQLPGNIEGQVFDENENALEGVKITVSDPERPDFKMEVTTRKNGRFRVNLANATVPYVFSFSKEGYQTMNIPNMKVPARQTTRRNFNLTSVAAAQTQAAAQGVDAGPSKGGPVAIYNEGVQALNGGDLVVAKQRFLDALDKSPEMASAHAALARVHLDEKSYAEAAGSAEEALRLKPDESNMYQILYQAYTELGEKDKAEAALAKMQTADPEKASKNLYNRAVDLFNAGNMDQAKPIFEQILTTDPDHAQVHYMLGLCYAGSDAAKAKVHLSRFLELAPDAPEASFVPDMINSLE